MCHECRPLSGLSEGRRRKPPANDTCQISLCTGAAGNASAVVASFKECNSGNAGAAADPAAQPANDTLFVATALAATLAAISAADGVAAGGSVPHTAAASTPGPGLAAYDASQAARGGSDSALPTTSPNAAAGTATRTVSAIGPGAVAVGTTTGAAGHPHPLAPPVLRECGGSARSCSRAQLIESLLHVRAALRGQLAKQLAARCTAAPVRGGGTRGPWGRLVRGMPPALQLLLDAYTEAPSLWGEWLKVCRGAVLPLKNIQYVLVLDVVSVCAGSVMHTRRRCSPATI